MHSMAIPGIQTALYTIFVVNVTRTRKEFLWANIANAWLRIQKYGKHFWAYL